MKQNKVLSLIGLATKAGRTTGGAFSVEKAVKAGKACLVIVSEQAAENTRKKFQNMCTFYQVPLYFLGTMEELGLAMGLEYRAVLAVTDAGFSGAIVKELTNRDERR